jgi:hypothetical protein
LLASLNLIPVQNTIYRYCYHVPYNMLPVCKMESSKQSVCSLFQSLFFKITSSSNSLNFVFYRAPWDGFLTQSHGTEFSNPKLLDATSVLNYHTKSPSRPFTAYGHLQHIVGMRLQIAALLLSKSHDCSANAVVLSHNRHEQY